MLLPVPTSELPQTKDNFYYHPLVIQIVNSVASIITFVAILFTLWNTVLLLRLHPRSRLPIFVFLVVAMATSIFLPSVDKVGRLLLNIPLLIALIYGWAKVGKDRGLKRRAMVSFTVYVVAGWITFLSGPLFLGATR